MGLQENNRRSVFKTHERYKCSTCWIKGKSQEESRVSLSPLVGVARGRKRSRMCEGLERQNNKRSGRVHLIDTYVGEDMRGESASRWDEGPCLGCVGKLQRTNPRRERLSMVQRQNLDSCSVASASDSARTCQVAVSSDPNLSCVPGPMKMAQPHWPH